MCLGCAYIACWTYIAWRTLDHECFCGEFVVAIGIVVGIFPGGAIKSHSNAEVTWGAAAEKAINVKVQANSHVFSTPTLHEESFDFV